MTAKAKNSRQPSRNKLKRVTRKLVASNDRLLAMSVHLGHMSDELQNLRMHIFKLQDLQSPEQDNDRETAERMYLRKNP
jgi:hypothetical protein